MTKSESKYFNTALLMDEALIDLLGKKDLAFITVKEICDKAGVNRSTFYLHYETVSDLIDEALKHINEEFIKSFSVDAEKFIGSLGSAPLEELVFINDRYLLPYLNFVKEHKRVFKTAINNPSGMQAGSALRDLSTAVLKPVFTRFGIPEEDQKYWLAYHIQGVSAIVNEWLKNNCEEPVDELSRIIQNCVRPGKYRQKSE